MVWGHGGEEGGKSVVQRDVAVDIMDGRWVACIGVIGFCIVECVDNMSVIFNGITVLVFTFQSGLLYEYTIESAYMWSGEQWVGGLQVAGRQQIQQRRMRCRVTVASISSSFAPTIP